MQHRLKLVLLISLFLSNISYADLPIFSKKLPLTMVSYEDNDSGLQGGIAQVFFSNGKYCFMMAGGGGGVALVGKWRYVTPTQITVKFDPFPPSLMKDDDGFLSYFKPFYQAEGKNLIMMNADNHNQIYTTINRDEFRKEKFDPNNQRHQEYLAFCQSTNKF